MQNNPTPNGSMIEPVAQQPFAPSAPGMTPMNTGAQLTSDGSQATPPEVKKKRSNTLIETILLVIVSIIAVVFVWLYVQKYIQWDTVSKDVDGQINRAVAIAEAEKEEELEAIFAEREKSPYTEFTGPDDYGRLSFMYPKTWSVYIAKDAVKGGDFEAYLNPVAVQPVSNTTINALRVRIRDTSFDTVARSYENSVKNGKLTMKTDTVGGVLANIYTGEITNSLRGAVMILKLRDKTVMLQTDAEQFMEEFYKILESVKLVE